MNDIGDAGCGVTSPLYGPRTGRFIRGFPKFAMELFSRYRFIRHTAAQMVHCAGY